MARFFLVLSAILVPSLLATAGNTAYTPKPGTKERKAILDAARAPLEQALKQKVIFRVQHLKVKDGWAFLKGMPRTKEDKPISYKGTTYEEESTWADEGMIAILRKKSGKWQVVDHSLFQTDVWWYGIHEKLKAPEEIFDYFPMKK